MEGSRRPRFKSNIHYCKHIDHQKLPRLCIFLIMRDSPQLEPSGNANFMLKPDPQAKKRGFQFMYIGFSLVTLSESLLGGGFVKNGIKDPN